MVNATKEEMEAAFLGAKLFYFTMTALVIFVLILYKNPLLYALFNGNFVHIIGLYTLIIISSYLLVTVGRNPGFAKESGVDDLEKGNNYILYDQVENQK